jgi:glycosyltransferase involved in cell wall biosynthesis
MDTPSRVLTITSEWPTPAQPDAVPFIVRQVEFVRRAGIEVDVFAFHGGRKPSNYFRAWRRLRPLLRDGRYDLIHAQFGQSGLLPWPKRHPLVVTFRGCDLLGVKDDGGRSTPSGLFLQRMCQLVARRADAVVVVSSHMRPCLPESVRPHVLPSGLDFDSLPRMPRGEARAELGLPGDETLLLFAGNPQDGRKRYDLARRAVEILNARMEARLVVGWGVPHATMVRLMNACDALVFTSRQEGSPNVVKEALACDLPVVSVAVGDVPERICGVEGCELCPDGRPESIAAALERTLRRGGRVAGREAVRSLDERLLTEQLLGIYRGALAGWKRCPSPVLRRDRAR